MVKDKPRLCPIMSRPVAIDYGDGSQSGSILQEVACKRFFCMAYIPEYRIHPRVGHGEGCKLMGDSR